MTIAVVVPFCGQTEGLLVRAIRSIAAQPEAAGIRVVVVDQLSRALSAAKIATLGSIVDPLRIDIVSQPGTGAAAALNRGLDFLGSDVGSDGDSNVTRVAFLDPEDAWSVDHLGRANRALAAGHDGYFANWTEAERSDRASRAVERIAGEQDEPIADPAYPFASVDDLVDRVLHGRRAIAASTVVYAFERFRAQRFDESVRRAHADALFCLSLARAGARFACRAEVEATRVVDVDARRVAGPSPTEDGSRIQDAMRYRKRLLDFDLTDAQRRFVQDAIAQLRVEFAADLVDRVLRRQPIGIDLLRAQFALDPIGLFALPHHAGQLVAERIKGSRRSG